MSTQTGQCTKCRAVNSYSAINCIECGTRLPWAELTQNAQGVSAQPQSTTTHKGLASGATPATAAPNPKRKLPVWVLGGIGAVTLVAVVLIVGMFRGAANKSADNAPPADPNASVTVTDINISPFTTRTGGGAQIIQATVHNIGKLPIITVLVELTLYDDHENAFEVNKNHCVYATYLKLPVLAPGATYTQTGSLGYIHVPIRGVTPLVKKATATVSKVEFQQEP